MIIRRHVSHAEVYVIRAREPREVEEVREEPVSEVRLRTLSAHERSKRLHDEVLREFRAVRALVLG